MSWMTNGRSCSGGLSSCSWHQASSSPPKWQTCPPSSAWHPPDKASICIVGGAEPADGEAPHQLPWFGNSVVEPPRLILWLLVRLEVHEWWLWSSDMKNNYISLSASWSLQYVALVLTLIKCFLPSWVIQTQVLTQFYCNCTKSDWQLVASFQYSMPDEPLTNVPHGTFCPTVWFFLKLLFVYRVPWKCPHHRCCR